ncbi:MAG: glycosyltransferase family 4 protein [Pyrinomonadaceae bacterium]
MTRTIRLLSVMEATTVTGPAKNLLGFAARARSREFTEPLGLPRVETTVVTFVRGADASGEPNAFVGAARAAGVEVVLIPERFRFDPSVFKALRSAVERCAPDVLQTHSVKSHLLLRLSGLGRRYPWVAFHHGYTTPDAKMRLYNQLDRWSLPSAARVVTVCGPFAERLASAGVRRERISVLHNSVAPASAPEEGVARALGIRLGLGEGERVILSVGRLSQEKGHADLVAALGHLGRLAPGLSFRLVLVGDGPERARLEEEARARGLSERVVFAGHHADVRPFYALADVLVLPSYSEGSPNVLLEAMAAGVPVVATAVGGVPEIVAHEESALLIAPRDERAMAEALARILSDATLARGLAAKAAELAAERFSPEAYARSVLEIYTGLDGGGSGAAPATAPA